MTDPRMPHASYRDVLYLSERDKKQWHSNEHAKSNKQNNIIKTCRTNARFRSAFIYSSDKKKKKRNGIELQMVSFYV